MQTYVDDVLNKMTIDEKIGQLNLVAPGGFTQTGPTVGGKNFKISKQKDQTSPMIPTSARQSICSARFTILKKMVRPRNNF